MTPGLQDRNEGAAWQRRTWFNTFVIALCLVVIGLFQVIRWFQDDDASSVAPRSASSAVELERQYYLLKTRAMETKANQATLSLQECGDELDQVRGEALRLGRYKDEAERLRREVKRVRDECSRYERDREREKEREKKEKKEKEKAKEQWGGYQLPPGE